MFILSLQHISKAKDTLLSKFIPKITNQFWRFLVLWAHLLKITTIRFGMGVRTWDSLPHAKFC